MQTHSKTALTAGLIGAGTLNVLHELSRKTMPNGPRMDLIAMRALDRLLKPRGIRLSRKQLRAVAFGGDVVSNAFYYAVIGAVVERFSKPLSARALYSTALALGFGAGLGAVFLPRPMGLGQQPTQNMPLTASLTIGVYVAGALAAAAAYHQLRKRDWAELMNVQWPFETYESIEISGSVT